MNVALSELPDFTALPGRAPAEHHASGIIIAPSLAYMERAYFDARTLGWSRRPIVELVIPSTIDDTLAPRGQHVASLFCQHVAPKLPGGSSWDDHREAVADLIPARPATTLRGRSYVISGASASPGRHSETDHQDPRPSSGVAPPMADIVGFFLPCQSTRTHASCPR